MPGGYNELEWEIRASRHGEPTLLLGGRAVYSLYDPLQDAVTLADCLAAEMRAEQNDHLIIIGWGLGYLPQALAEAGVAAIVVWEPFPIMQKSFPPAAGEWRRGVCLVHTSEEFRDQVKALAVSGAKPKIIVHPGYNFFSQFEYQCALQILEQLYRSRHQEGYIISQRSLEAVVRLPQLGTIGQWAGALTGRAVVLANPGPSLKPCLAVLQQAPHVPVMASTQAAPFLQKNGVRVDFLVSAEVVDMTPFLNDCQREVAAFFAETSADPRTIAWLPEKTFLFHFACRHLQEQLWKQAQLPIFGDPLATVSEAMVLLADHLGCANVFCVGMDSCWREERYAYRTPGNPYDAAISKIGKSFRAMATDNEPAWTKHHYFHAARYLQWKGQELEKKGTKIYQMRGGLDIGATENLTPATLADRLQQQPPAQVPQRRPISPFTAAQVRQVLAEAKKDTAVHQRHTEVRGLNPNIDLWPCLQELPPGERQSKIDECIRSLQTIEQGTTP